MTQLLEAPATGETEPTIRRDERGRLLPGFAALPGSGRPRKTESYQALAANRPTAKKLAVIVKQEQQAIQHGSTRAAEFLRDTAEGKPATRIIIQSSPHMEELSSEWEVEAAESAVVAELVEGSK